MKLNVSFNDLEYIDGFFYVASNRDNGLYRFDEDWCELVGKFEGEDERENLFMQTCLYKNKIIFTPSCANKIHIYDLSEKKFSSIVLQDEGHIIGKFHGVVVSGGNAYFLGHTYSTIVKLNLDTYCVEYMECATRALNDFTGENSLHLTFGYLNDGILYAVRAYTNIILEINLEEEKARIRVLEEVGEKIWGYFIENNIEYVLSSTGLYVLENGKIAYKATEYELPDKVYLFSAYKYGNKLYFLPYKDHYLDIPIVVETSFENGISVCVRRVIEQHACSYGCVKGYANKLYLPVHYNGNLKEYDMLEDCVIEHGSVTKLRMLFENDMVGLEAWLSLI